VRQAPSPVRCGRHDPFGKLRARQAQGKLLGAVWLFFNYTRRVKESRWKTGDGIGVRVARWYGLICSEILRRHSHISEARCGAPGGGESTTTPSGRTLRWVTGHRPQRYGWQRAWGMEKWKPLRASHFSTPPTATRLLTSSLRYTNNPTGAKDRADHDVASSDIAKHRRTSHILLLQVAP
jgi:hypothetical protein